MYHDNHATIQRIANVLARLSEREIAVLMMGIQRDRIAYPPGATATQTLLAVIRREIEQRRSER